MKRTMDIEALLRWAYCEELPKAIGSASDRPRPMRPGWRGVESFTQLLAVIDENHFGVVPNLAEAGEPHPDAVAVHAAVADLDACELVVPDDWHPASDLGDLGDEIVRLAALALGRVTVRDEEGHLRFKCLRRLVERNAILGIVPDWQMERPERKVVRGANGKAMWFRRVEILDEPGDERLGIPPIWREVEVDGYNARRARPYPDAYQKTFLSPDPLPGLIERAEYEAWHAALGILFDSLAGTLDSVVLLPTSRPVRPWEVPAAASPRVLESIVKPLPNKALAPKRRRKVKIAA